MIMLAGIDGTGPSDNVEYSLEFKNSHVNSIVRNWRNGPSLYWRGPGNLGFETKKLADLAATFVDGHATMCRANNKKFGVFLVGYSRGAASVINACEQLYMRDIVVDCLLLFDAVDRTRTLEADKIPYNVRTCYHALRDPYTFSRSSFGNCGRAVASTRTAYQEKEFHCTHGGVGGTPWPAGGPVNAIAETYFLLDVFSNRGVPANWGNTNITPAVDAYGSQLVGVWSGVALRKEIANCQRRLADPNDVPWFARSTSGQGPRPSLGNFQISVP